MVSVPFADVVDAFGFGKACQEATKGEPSIVNVIFHSCRTAADDDDDRQQVDGI